MMKTFLIFQSSRVNTARIYKAKTSLVSLMMQIPSRTGRQRVIDASRAILSFCLRSIPLPHKGRVRATPFPVLAEYLQT